MLKAYLQINTTSTISSKNLKILSNTFMEDSLIFFIQTHPTSRQTRSKWNLPVICVLTGKICLKMPRSQLTPCFCTTSNIIFDFFKNLSVMIRVRNKFKISAFSAQLRKDFFQFSALEKFSLILFFVIFQQLFLFIFYKWFINFDLNIQ